MECVYRGLGFKEIDDDESVWTVPGCVKEEPLERKILSSPHQEGEHGFSRSDPRSNADAARPVVGESSWETEEVEVRVAVIGSTSNEASVALAERWAAIGLDAELMTAREAAGELRSGDVALGRLDVLPSLDGVEKGLFDLLRLERRGIRVINPVAALLAAHDKLRTAWILHAAGVPHPVTRHLRDSDAVGLSPPLVLKPRFGSWGADVVLCCTESAVRDRLAEVSKRTWFRRHGVLVQTAVPSAGHDLRVLIAAGRVVGAIERTAAPGEWRTNVACGGACEPVAVSPAAGELAATAAAAIEADLVGVDLMPLGDDRYVVLELNGAVDFGDDYVLGDADLYVDIAAALGLAGSVSRRATVPQHLTAA